MEGYPDPPELRGIIPKSFEVGAVGVKPYHVVVPRWALRKLCAP